MGNGGGKCASREQSARSSRPPRLRSKRRETLVQASTSSVALKPSSSKEKAIEFDPATLVPVIGKKDPTEVAKFNDDGDNRIDTNITFDVDNAANESGRRLQDDEIQRVDMKVADMLLEDRSIPVNNRTADPGQIPAIPGFSVETPLERSASLTDSENQGSLTAPLATSETEGATSHNSRTSADTTASPRDYQPWKEWFSNCTGELGEKVLDVVFFHGLQRGHGRSAREKTWTNSDGALWPRDWLPRLLEGILNGRKLRVLGIAYNAQASSWRTGDYGVRADGHKDIAHNLSQILIVSESCPLGRNPFVLVSHSYGGIVIKSLVAYCNGVSNSPLERGMDRLKIAESHAAAKFMEELQACVFYGVPHRGSIFATIASCFLLRTGRTVSELRPGSREILQLNREYELAMQKRHVIQYAFVETIPVVWNCMVVDSSSARGSLDDHEYVALPGTSHKTVCKHRTIQSVGIVKFVELIKKVATALDPAPLVVPISTNENAYSGHPIHRGDAAQNCNEETQGRDMKVADAFLLEDRSIPVNNRTADPGQIPAVPAHVTNMIRDKAPAPTRKDTCAAAQLGSTLYVGNLAWSVGEADLAKVCQGLHVGDVKKVEVIYDQQRRKSRGFAFVTMATNDDAHALISALDGFYMRGRALKVNFAHKWLTPRFKRREG
ncbi:uncharacterized protein [Physcomitrium patens]|uniref:uncharacterized protein isoform X2 n=1 Tax=Physcomitrium patens TaxID=3218 RepID=UPI000D15BCDA|nr:uncharacterized protein LOC112286569 isoform X2 [Physcomitrium patens]|eukprot:XP_024384315.1 uncharacterized protein LOC112286569 isoform X2 [Physcomitrella patens]